MAGYLNANLENLAGGDALSQALDFVGWNQKRQYNQEALRQQQINRDMALEDLFQTRQMNPLRVKSQRLSNEGTTLDNTFKSLTNQGKQRDWDVRKSIPLEAEQALAQAINENKISAVDLDAADKQLELALRSSDPNVRKQAEAILPLTKRMREIYTQGEERRKLEETKQAGAQALARLRSGLAASSKAVKAGAEKQPSNVNAYIAQLRNKALNEVDPERKQAYIDEAQSMATWLSDMQVRAAAARSAGQVDAAQVSSLPTREVPPAPKIDATNKGEDWIARAMKANPGMSREQVVEQGKKLGKL